MDKQVESVQPAERLLLVAQVAWGMAVGTVTPRAAAVAGPIQTM